LKKRLLVFVVMLTLLFSMSSASFANENITATTMDQSQAQGLTSNNQSTTPSDEISVDPTQVQALVSDGLSVDNAQYILKLDKKLKNVKNKIIIDDQTPTLSDSDVTKDVKGFQKKVLALDPAALKKGLEAKAIKNGSKDLEKMMKKNPEQDKYRVDYSDGSWVEVDLTLERISLPDSLGVVLNGYTEKEIQSTAVGDGTWVKTYEMKQLTATSYAKQFVTLTWKVTGTKPTPNGTATATAVSINGGGASYGTIQYIGGSTVYTGSTTATAKWNSSATMFSTATNPVQAQCSCVFSTIGAIGLGGVFSITVNGTWTQYSIIRVWGTGLLRTYAAYYY